MLIQTEPLTQSVQYGKAVVSGATAKDELVDCKSFAPPLNWTGANWTMSKTIQKAISSALRPRLRVMWRDEIALGPGKAELLALVEETGSINQAAHRMGMSYMRAWSLVKTMNQCFKEPLVVSERGGRGGGGAKLTAAGRRSLELYHQMEMASLQATRSGWRELQKLLRVCPSVSATKSPSRASRLTTITFY